MKQLKNLINKMIRLWPIAGISVALLTVHLLILPALSLEQSVAEQMDGIVFDSAVYRSNLNTEFMNIEIDSDKTGQIQVDPISDHEYEAYFTQNHTRIILENQTDIHLKTLAPYESITAVMSDGSEVSIPPDFTLPSLSHLIIRFPENNSNEINGMNETVDLSADESSGLDNQTDSIELTAISSSIDMETSQNTLEEVDAVIGATVEDNTTHQSIDDLEQNHDINEDINHDIRSDIQMEQPINDTETDLTVQSNDEPVNLTEPVPDSNDAEQDELEGQVSPTGEPIESAQTTPEQEDKPRDTDADDLMNELDFHSEENKEDEQTVKTIDENQLSVPENEEENNEEENNIENTEDEKVVQVDFEHSVLDYEETEEHTKENEPENIETANTETDHIDTEKTEIKETENAETENGEPENIVENFETENNETDSEKEENVEIKDHSEDMETATDDVSDEKEDDLTKENKEIENHSEKTDTENENAEEKTSEEEIKEEISEEENTEEENTEEEITDENIKEHEEMRNEDITGENTDEQAEENEEKKEDRKENTEKEINEEYTTENEEEIIPEHQEAEEKIESNIEENENLNEKEVDLVNDEEKNSNSFCMEEPFENGVIRIEADAVNGKVVAGDTKPFMEYMSDMYVKNAYSFTPVCFDADGNETSVHVKVDSESTVYKEEYGEFEEMPDEFDMASSETFICAEVLDVMAGTIASGGNGYNISVTYDEDAMIPSNAILQTDEITDEERIDSMKEALGVDVLPYVRLFDISIMSDGDEMEPDSNVTVSVDLEDKPVGSTLQVVHFTENGCEVLGTNYAEFVTDSFSTYGFAYTYTVDFFHDGSEYHMTGGDTIPLRELLDALSIYGEVKDVSFSSDELIVDTNQIKSIAPFTTSEILTVVMEDRTVSISVEDAINYQDLMTVRITNENENGETITGSCFRLSVQNESGVYETDSQIGATASEFCLDDVNEFNLPAANYKLTQTVVDNEYILSNDIYFTVTANGIDTPDNQYVSVNGNELTVRSLRGTLLPDTGGNLLQIEFLGYLMITGFMMLAILKSFQRRKL